MEYQINQGTTKILPKHTKLQMFHIKYLAINYRSLDPRQISTNCAAGADSGVKAGGATGSAGVQGEVPRPWTES
jgi:hypothetical protein